MGVISIVLVLSKDWAGNISGATKAWISGNKDKVASMLSRILPGDSDVQKAERTDVHRNMQGGAEMAELLQSGAREYR